MARCASPVALGIACGLALAAAAVRPACAAPPDSLTVRECAALALRGSLETQAARWAALAAAREADATRHNAAPRLRLHSGALVAPSGFYDPAITNLGQYDAKLVMDLTLADGDQRRRERTRAETSAQAAGADLTASSTGAALEAARLAGSVLATRGRIEARLEEERWTSQVLDAVRSGARVGARSPSDVYRLQLEVQTLAMDRGDLQSELLLSARTLGAFLMPDSPGTAYLAVRETTWAESAPSPDDSLAAVHRFELSANVRRAEAASGLAQIDLETARRRGAAQLGLSVDAGLAGTDLTRGVPPSFSDRLRRDLGASASLDLSLPLRPPGQAATVAAREADLSAARVRLRMARSAARLGALDLVSRWRDGARRLAAADTAAVLARSNLLRIRSLYLAGSATLLELLDARRAWQDTADRQATARNDLHLIIVESEIAR